jgi:actin-like ATPase involved in cell morphogenesis
VAYVVGIDLGTTFSAAAIWRDGRAEMVSLGSRGAAIPSVVVLHVHGDVLVGEAAEHRALSEPTRTAREFKRRLGDPVPIVLGGTPYGAEALTAHLLRAIYDQVVEQHGEAPDAIVLTHPANYGPYKLDLLREAVRLADVGSVTFVSEPEAAAVEYAQRERLDAGQVVAVYDFGGGTFDAAVLRKTAEGFEVLGTPEGMDRVGGIDFDQAVFSHVDASLGGLVSEVDTSEPTALAALARLRDDCRAAKEALSTDTDTAIPVMLPNVQTEVRLTRPEFEAMIAPRVTETIAALERAIRSAGVASDEVTKVLLVGGTSRIPLVAEMIREATGLPVAVDAHPKFAIALGAATAGAPVVAPTVVDAPAPLPPVAPPAAAPAPEPAPVAPTGGPNRGRGPLLIGGAAALLVVIAAAAVLVGGGDDDNGAPADRATTTTAAASTPTAEAVTDDFSDPGSGFPVIDQSEAAARYASGEYQVSLRTQGALPRFVRALDGPELEDVTVEVVERRRSDTASFAGLVCRSDSEGGLAYAAVVNRQGGWAIMQTDRDAAELRTLAEGENAPRDTATGERRLRLECTGGRDGTPAVLRLAVGDTVVGEASDPSPLPGGQVGLAVIGQTGATVAFDDFRARPLHP